MDSSTQPVQGFDSLGLSPALLSVLTRASYTTPTPIQAQAIPVALQGRDVIGLAQTGTGKTLAFALPILERLLQEPGRALVIVPTRELALQVEESFRKLTRALNRPLRSVCLIGGMPIYRQIKDLKMHPAIIIATPGRLNDHLEQRTVELSDVKILVLDEADRMLDMGFAPQIKRICTTIPKERQTLLFSATLAPEIASLAAEYQNNPERIEVTPPGSTTAQIEQQLCYVSQEGKMDLLQELLKEYTGTVLVFSRTKHGASKLAVKVQGMGHTATEIHSNRSLGQRRQALDGFKSGRYRVLVATDVAARGIDVKDISLVVNFDLPDAAEDYVHRIGRTGRAGASGLAISFARPDQHRDVKGIERLLGSSLPVSERSTDKPDTSFSGSSRPRSNNFRSNDRRPSSGGERRPQFSGRPQSSSPRPSSGGGLFDRSFRPKQRRKPVFGSFS